MGNFPIVQVVDSLDAGRTLFDFNPGRDSVYEMWLGADGFDYGTPEWDSSVLGIQEGTRTLTLSFRARGRAAEGQISRLSELLTRVVPGYLMFQTRQDSEPVWFRLQRNTSANPLDFTTVWSDDADNSTWRWQVTLVADAFALGAKQTLTATTVLGAAGTAYKAPVQIVDTIVGDAPAPLNLDIAAGDLSNYRAELMSWALDPAATVNPWCGGATLNQTFTASTGIAAYDVGALPSTPPPGQYRCMLYVQRTTTSGTARWQGGLATDSGLAPVLSAGFTDAPGDGTFDPKWVDAGRINLPPGMDFTDIPEDGLPALDWQVQVSSGGTSSQKWKITRFLIVPVQTVNTRAATTVLGVKFGNFPDDAVMRVDSERSRAGIAVDDKWQIGLPPVIDGAFPRVHPGAHNYVMLLPRTNSATVHDYGTSGSTTMWYYPRHLQVGSH